jgi:hypothetical protein
MKTFLILTRWQFRQLYWINGLFTGTAVIATLSMYTAIDFLRTPFFISVVLLHCALMVLLLGRSEPRGPGYLYAQGFSRDQLWWSTFFATFLSGLLVCFCVWLTIISGARAQIQAAIGNPWFPLAGTIDAKSAKWFLLEYGLLLPPMHYVWIRARQPQSDAGAGWTLAMGSIAFYGYCLMSLSQASTGQTVLLSGISILLAVVSLIGCWRFHRNVEVQS